MKIGGTIAIAAALALSGCGTDNVVTDSKAPVVLFVSNIAEGQPILSDIVSPNNTVVNCDVNVTATAFMKNPGATPGNYELVRLSSYKVKYTRSDGQNVQGVDVPYEITGPVTVTVDPATDGTEFAITIVRHQAKIEPPLKNITGLDIVTMSAEITLYGHTLNGDGVSGSGSVQVTFADYGDGTDTCES
jgi:hypothetical protein